MTEGKIPSILSPSMFVSEALCELTFEDALDKGLKRSMELEDREWRDTSLRFCVPGLYNVLKVHSKSIGRSVYCILRDSCWMIASKCENDEALVGIVREYFILLRELVENTDYTDLADRMNESFKVKNVGYSGKPVTLKVPIEAHGVISDCATALGVSFSTFYQAMLGWCLSQNTKGTYQKWVSSIVDTLMDELYDRIKRKLLIFKAIRSEVEILDSSD